MPALQPFNTSRRPFFMPKTKIGRSRQKQKEENPLFLYLNYRKQMNITILPKYLISICKLRLPESFVKTPTFISRKYIESGTR
jgi:hypothetical protein